MDQANQAANRARAALTPAQASLVTAQQQLATLETAAREAQQHYTEAQAREQRAQLAASAADRYAQDTASFAGTAKSLLGRLVAAAYRNGAATDLSSLTIVLDVKDPQQYMSGVHVVKRLLTSQASILTQAEAADRDATGARAGADQVAAELNDAEAALAPAAQAAQQSADAAQAQVTALGKQMDALLAQQGAAQNAATELAEQRQAGIVAQQQALTSDGGGSGPAQQLGAGFAAAYSSGIADQAVAFALAQLGKPYTWGGTGPDSFDCSGLAMRAYGSAGVQLPHFAAFQYQASHPLGYGQLQPGDLLFWATDPSDSNTIYHEAIYLGDQKMVQAPKTGWNVMISNMWMWGPIQFYARPY